MKTETLLSEYMGAVMRLQSFPQMAKIRPSIDLQRKTLTVTAPGVEDLVLFLDDHACFELSVILEDELDRIKYAHKALTDKGRP
jgi:hypothetical protein